MGPRSDNRGYVWFADPLEAHRDVLQWVHGRITVVMRLPKRLRLSQGRLQLVHGRITVVMKALGVAISEFYVWLQWVHGRITVVMSRSCRGILQHKRASMGPRSDNRGYASRIQCLVALRFI